jgi:hypothetical protein
MPSSALILIALGVIGGGLFLLQALLEVPPRVFWTVAGIGIAVALAVGAVPDMARPLVALKAAVLFPLLAMALIPASPDEPGLWAGRGLLGAGWLVARTTLLTALGGLLCAAALTDTTYLMKIEQFRGVKLAQAVPLLLLAGVFAVRATDTYARKLKSRPRWAALGDGAVEIGRGVVKYWHVAAILGAVVALGVLLMRSGNEPAFGVSGLEMQFRSLLDKVLGVRPRSKEIFVGYPALFVGLMLLLRRRVKIAWPFLAAGAISQVGLLNTFCHMHTPLSISLVRVAHGLWMGLLIGLVWWGIKRLGDVVYGAAKSE